MDAMGVIKGSMDMGFWPMDDGLSPRIIRWSVMGGCGWAVDDVEGSNARVSSDFQRFS